MKETLGNKALSSLLDSSTDGSTEIVPAPPEGLNAQQDAFCRRFAECGVATYAYEAVYQASSRAVARAAGARLMRNPRVRARIRELQDAAAQQAQRPAQALIAELEQMVDADPNELCSLTVGACRHCWSDPPGAYHWRNAAEMAKAVDAWLKSLNGPKPLPEPDTTGNFGYRPDREPNPECPQCDGAGVPRVKFNSTADASPGARRLLRGIEMFPDGSVKRLLLHDQTQLRIELHKLRGMHIDRSMSVTAHVHVEPLRDMTPAEIAELIQGQKALT